MKKLLLASLLALSFTANAQYMGTLPANADARLFYAQDSDDFKVMHTWIGAAHESGFGARVGYSRYTGKDPFTSNTESGYYGAWNYNSANDQLAARGAVDGISSTTLNSFSANSNVFQLTYVNVGENHDFHGAIGVRQTDYKIDRQATRNAIARNNAELDKLTLDGQLKSLAAVTLANGGLDGGSYSGLYTPDGVTVTSPPGDSRGSRTSLVADAELRLIMTDRLTIGVAVATDSVETPRSIEAGIRQVYTAASADYLLTEYINVNVIVGNNHFTDNNNRVFIRTKTDWTFVPEYGISTFFRTRNQHDHNSNSVYYFSPDNLAQQSLGLQVRKPYDGHVYLASVEYGSEQVTQGGVKDTHPIYAWQLGVQTNPGRKTGVTYGVSIIGSNSSGFNGGGAAYNWYGFNSWIKVPLK